MRNTKLTRLLALMLAMMMAFALAACGGSDDTEDANAGDTQQNEEQTEGNNEQQEVRDTFTMAISYMPDALSPAGNGSDDYTTMTRPLYDRLFMENNDGGIDYYLAKNLDISDDALT